jgi:putative ABC transport system permease protein
MSLTISVGRLALKDMAREPAHVFCIVALIAGILAPLMLMFAIKTGVMDTLIAALRENPNMRRIDIIGNHDFSDAQLAELRSWPELAFAAPEERSIARQLNVRKVGARGYQKMTLVSSAAGEPLLPAEIVLAPGQIAVSAPLASLYQLSVGDRLEVRATRGNPPTARLALELEVVHIVQRGWLEGRAGLAPYAFVSAVEAFYDGYALPQFDLADGRDLAERGIHYESFRIFANDIRGVAAAEARLEQTLGVTLRSRVAEIEPLLRLNRDIDRALTVLTICAGIGLAAALTALFWASVERKRLVLSMLSLMGVPPASLALFPIVQAAAFALAGAGAAIAIFLGGILAFEAVFAKELLQSAGSIAPIQPDMLAIVVVVLLVVALLASAIAARRAFAIEPAAVIRSGG